MHARWLVVMAPMYRAQWAGNPFPWENAQTKIFAHDNRASKVWPRCAAINVRQTNALPRRQLRVLSPPVCCDPADKAVVRAVRKTLQAARSGSVALCNALAAPVVAACVRPRPARP